MKPVSIVDLAYEIIEMERTIHRQAAELERLAPFEAMWRESVQSGINHSAKMVAGIMDLASIPGVMDAIAKSNEGKPELTAPP
jgi:hypothetical protein